MYHKLPFPLCYHQHFHQPPHFRNIPDHFYHLCDRLRRNQSNPMIRQPGFRSVQAMPITLYAHQLLDHSLDALIIHGNADRVVPYTYGERFHQIWPKSELVIQEYYDHGFSQNIYLSTDIVSQYLIKELK